MPNGQLEEHYGTKVLQAGKNPDKSRFRFTKVPYFELLEQKKSRVKVVYFDKKMDDKFKKALSFYEKIYDSQVEF
jgi:hypothetical protein